MMGFFTSTKPPKKQHDAVHSDYSSLPIATAIQIENGKFSSAPSAPPSSFIPVPAQPKHAVKIFTESGNSLEDGLSNKALVHSVPFYVGMGRMPSEITCPYCGKSGLTRVKDKIVNWTFGLVALICLVFWPLFWVPFCVPGCKMTRHKCEHCLKILAETPPFEGECCP